MSDLFQKMEMLYAATTHITPEHAKEIADDLYEFLTILDRKATSLMAFDGILLAVVTFTADKGELFRTRGLPRGLAVAIIFLALAASALCLFVAQMSYPVYAYVEILPNNTLDFSKDIRGLVDVIALRTTLYQTAWWLSIAALPLFLLTFVMSVKILSPPQMRRKRKP